MSPTTKNPTLQTTLKSLELIQARTGLSLREAVQLIEDIVKLFAESAQVEQDAAHPPAVQVPEAPGRH